MTASTSVSTTTKPSNLPILSQQRSETTRVANAEVKSPSNSNVSGVRVETDAEDFRDEDIITEIECDICLQRFPHVSVWKYHARKSHVPIDKREKTKYDFFTVHRRLK